jgi:hypothetical protein
LQGGARSQRDGGDKVDGEDRGGVAGLGCCDGLGGETEGLMVRVEVGDEVAVARAACLYAAVGAGESSSSLISSESESMLRRPMPRASVPDWRLVEGSGPPAVR